uniref:NADH-ubiquinone oxidoreductase chain 3 n=1 Tax=Cerion uva TaxID=1108933 RepID=A0A343AZW0_9EUPU|nr:NADH dehydrogenase subunit 3 [Cerion uva]AQL10427.1 NADH dehydrogenase subunit 3 [Cerion uva]
MYSVFFVTLLVVISLITISFIIKWVSNTNMVEKMSPFECGFDPLAPTRTPFSTRFILLLVFFLIFDVETVIMLPLSQSVMNSGDVASIYYSLGFLSILLLGLLYEWANGVLDWT